MAQSAKENDSASALKSKGGKRATHDSEQDSMPSVKKQKLSQNDGICQDSKEETPDISHIKKNDLKRTLPSAADGKQSLNKKLKLQRDVSKMHDAFEVEDFKAEPKEKKKPYHRRMKHTLNSVLEQMEFYFGDSSLSKDRYLKSMVDNSPDGYVDLCIFANFNKLQTLHKDGISRDILVHALSRSKILQLNEDKTKVKRVTPFKEINHEETDKRTVYVEHLPSHATHMWIKQIFSQCGKVAYVSLPTYKTSKQIKGFAFVEFETPDEADRACTMLNNPLPDKVMETPGKFPKTNKTLDRLQKIAPVPPAQDSNEENDPGQTLKDSSKSETADAELKKKKKKKTKKKKPQESLTDDVQAQTETGASEQKPEGKKKKKKRKRKTSQSHEPPAGVDCPASEQTEVTSEMQIRSGDDQEEIGGNVSSVGYKGTYIDDQLVSKTDAEGDKQSKSMPVDKLEEPAETGSSAQAKKKKKKRKKTKGDTLGAAEVPQPNDGDTCHEKSVKTDDGIDPGDQSNLSLAVTSLESEGKRLSHKERKLLRQADIRRKKQQRLESKGTVDDLQDQEASSKNRNSDDDSTKHPFEDSSRETSGSQPTSILKLKKAAEKKRVEFDPVPITTEFIEAKGARKRKKPKREKPHLRVISKKEWLSLKEEYISRQKSHMKALKESLRELRQQENAEADQPRFQQAKRVDLEDVFGTKPLKLSQEAKMSHVEQMKFTPNVIVQWWCSHEMHRDKIRTMFKETHAANIAYIDASEEAKSGYIRFKDEASAEEFAKMSRNSASFMARVLPVDQQEEYWEKANRDRMQKLGRKKKEQGSDRIARKMFQRNKATFFNKPSRIVFDEDDGNGAGDIAEKEDDKIIKSLGPETEHAT